MVPLSNGGEVRADWRPAELADMRGAGGAAPPPHEALIVSLRLALGRGVAPAESVDWVAVLAIALRERLAGIAWRRSGPAIRALAPRDVVDRWRTLAVVIDQRGEERLGALEQAVAALEAEGIESLVLKGMPLSARLYGDPFVRASDDIDLFIRPADRPAATRVLVGAGWRLVEGEPPWDELFMRPDASRTYLEVHEMLVTDYLAHIRLPEPTAQVIHVGGSRVRCFAGPMEAVYLAAHLAGHQQTPLLWGIDFLTMWTRLDDRARADARAAARVIGLDRYLQWAIAFASDVDAAGDGDRTALVRLGVRGADRSDTHLSVWRHARLASHPLDAIRAVGACLWPRPIRWNVVALVTLVAKRLRYRGVGRAESARLRAEDVLRVAGGRPAAIPMADDRAGFKLSGSAALEVVREAIAVAGSARVRAAGMSMWPTLADGSLVTVIARPSAVRPGQIILMDWGGRPVLHRVVRVAGDVVQTAGDACLELDPPTPIDRVHALAIAVSDERGVVTLVGSLRHGVRSWLRYAHARTRLMLARRWRRVQGLGWR
jgi:hypothetical protein